MRGEKDEEEWESIMPEKATKTCLPLQNTSYNSQLENQCEELSWSQCSQSLFQSRCRVQSNKPVPKDKVPHASYQMWNRWWDMSIEEDLLRWRRVKGRRRGMKNRSKYYLLCAFVEIYWIPWLCTIKNSYKRTGEVRIYETQFDMVDDLLSQVSICILACSCSRCRPNVQRSLG